MVRLESEHPVVYQKLIDGFLVVGGSDRKWAGLSTDLVIEPVLMKSVTTSAGLTRGRGMTEQQRLIWLLSMPVCAEVNRAMLDLTDVSYSNGEQTKDISESRKNRDMKDTKTLLNVLADQNSFTGQKGLRKIMNGVHANDTVNVDDAKDIGQGILASMTGTFVTEFAFKRSNQAVTLATKSSVKFDGEKIQVDPQLLFQRLIVALKSLNDMKAIFKFELCSYPPALFDSSLMLLQPHKPALANAIWAMTMESSDVTAPQGELQFVLDGVALIHRIPWPRGCTRNVCALYCNYVDKKYGKAIIVFDGYTRTSTKT